MRNREKPVRVGMNESVDYTTSTRGYGFPYPPYGFLKDMYMSDPECMDDIYDDLTQNAAGALAELIPEMNDATITIGPDEWKTNADATLDMKMIPAGNRRIRFDCVSYGVWYDTLEYIRVQLSRAMSDPHPLNVYVCVSQRGKSRPGLTVEWNTVHFIAGFRDSDGDDEMRLNTCGPGDDCLGISPKSRDAAEILNGIQEAVTGRIVNEFEYEPPKRRRRRIGESVDYTTDADGYGNPYSAYGFMSNDILTDWSRSYEIYDDLTRNVAGELIEMMPELDETSVSISAAEYARASEITPLTVTLSASDGHGVPFACVAMHKRYDSISCVSVTLLRKGDSTYVMDVYLDFTKDCSAASEHSVPFMSLKRIKTDSGKTEIAPVIECENYLRYILPKDAAAAELMNGIQAAVCGRVVHDFLPDVPKSRKRRVGESVDYTADNPDYEPAGYRPYDYLRRTDLNVEDVVDDLRNNVAEAIVAEYPEYTNIDTDFMRGSAVGGYDRWMVTMYPADGEPAPEAGYGSLDDCGIEFRQTRAGYVKLTATLDHDGKLVEVSADAPATRIDEFTIAGVTLSHDEPEIWTDSFVKACDEDGRVFLNTIARIFLNCPYERFFG